MRLWPGQGGTTRPRAILRPSAAACALGAGRAAHGWVWRSGSAHAALPRRLTPAALDPATHVLGGATAKVRGCLRFLRCHPPPPSPPQDASHPLSAAPAFARCRGPPRGGPPRPWTPSSRRVRRRPSPPSQTAGGGCSRRVWAAHPPCRRRLPCCRPRRLWQRTDRRRALRCRHHHRRRRHRRCQRRRLGRRRRQAPSRSRLFRLQPTP